MPNVMVIYDQFDRLSDTLYVTLQYCYFASFLQMLCPKTDVTVKLQHDGISQNKLSAQKKKKKSIMNL